MSLDRESSTIWQGIHSHGVGSVQIFKLKIATSFKFFTLKLSVSVFSVSFEYTVASRDSPIPAFHVSLAVSGLRLWESV